MVMKNAHQNWLSGDRILVLGTGADVTLKVVRSPLSHTTGHPCLSQGEFTRTITNDDWDRERSESVPRADQLTPGQTFGRASARFVPARMEW